MKDPNWKKIHEIIFDFSVPENFTQPIDLLAGDIEKHLPSDIGLSVIQIRNNIPFCMRWPESTSQKIKDFNTRLNKKAPAVFDYRTQLMRPVTWKIYSGTEYDTDFNIPLHIGYSLGIGIIAPLTNRQLLLCLHNERHGRNFKAREWDLIQNIQPILQRIFSRREIYQYFEYRRIMPRELEDGCTALSPREREIFNYLTTRLTMAEISDQLGISRRTVETHALHIYQKLCICSRKELLRFLQEEDKPYP